MTYLYIFEALYFPLFLFVQKEVINCLPKLIKIFSINKVNLGINSK